MSTVRSDISIPAHDGDGALHVQTDVRDERQHGYTCRFTIDFAVPRGMPPHVALKEMAQFILTRGKP